MDRGAADRYYGRSYDPHWWPEGTNKGSKVALQDMSVDEICAYTKGFNEEEDRKDWG
jgi:hypothetical protein